MDRARPLPRRPGPLLRGRFHRGRSQLWVHVSHWVHGRPGNRTRHPFDQHARRDCTQAVHLRLSIQHRPRVARLYAASNSVRRVRCLGFYQPSRLAWSWSAFGPVDCYRGSPAANLSPDERSYSYGCMVWGKLPAGGTGMFSKANDLGRTAGLSRGRGPCLPLT